MEVFMKISAIAGAVLPLFNIPLIIRIMKRKSADDISLVWVFGVWICILLMSPAAFMSSDFAFRIFGYANVVFFTGVVIVTVKYHHWFKKNLFLGTRDSGLDKAKSETSPQSRGTSPNH